MEFRSLSDKEKDIYCRMVELGIYPYRTTANGAQMLMFVVDDRGCWWGTGNPPDYVKKQVDEEVRAWRSREK